MDLAHRLKVLRCAPTCGAHTAPDPEYVSGPPRETTLEAPCPVCNHSPLTLRSLELDLPFFGDAIQTTLTCPACGYHHGDLLLIRQREAVRITLRVARPEQLSDRVARSSSATIRIPELGAAMEPGPRAEAFVSNVEGVLRRFLDVVLGQEAVAETKHARAAVARTRRRIEGMIDGKEPFTFVIEDPTGNSEVQDDEAVRALLSREEAAALKSSEPMIDLSDLAWADKEG